MDVLWGLLFFGGLGALWYIGYRIDPHWSTRDGTRFVCNSQVISLDETIGRKKEAQVNVIPDGTLIIGQRLMLRRRRSTWVITGKSEAPPKGKTVYLVRKTDGGTLQIDQMALFLPTKSRCIKVLDDALAARQSRAR
ncbi:MAG: hypothetical protein H6513_17855 [Acidimicrobiaceae bacterium]|nr:hypothetical protein [Ilumatobacter sp.]MCB9382552.1 hypothetical protein [Acidimicrobiaceae bacterium]MCO5329041.1 hypothetical protein [Ilumatobacteraceae bacterium]